MFMERNSGKSTIDYPMGGSKAIVEALIRGERGIGESQVMVEVLTVVSCQVGCSDCAGLEN